VVVLGGEVRECSFESEYGHPPVEFVQLGINVTVLEPGQNSLYSARVKEGTRDWRLAYTEVERFRREWPPNWTRLPRV
jgi:hypothetical protein